MIETTFCGRLAATIENPSLRVTVLVEGGHIAEILDKRSGLSPLWIPPWPSIEPSTYDREKHPEYGGDIDARLLAGIMGHNLCLDLFGGPSPQEAKAGIPVHGEGAVVPYRITGTDHQMTLQAKLPLAELQFERILTLQDREIRIEESVENVSACDRPIAWTQHVTLGPPFLERGVTQFRASATQSKVFESEFGTDAYLKTGAEFEWPRAPRRDGGWTDLRILNGEAVSSAFTTHLMDRQRDHAFFVAFAPKAELAFGYVWRRDDFPWLGIWEENHSRSNAPWNGRTLTRGMEFGVSPMPESRREMVQRGNLFGVPSFCWLGAKTRLHVQYWAVMLHTHAIPEILEWPE